jgi:PhnB protein
MKIPEGYQAVMPYLIVPGGQRFLEFTQKVFQVVENIEHRSMRDENTIRHNLFADSPE